MADGRIDSGRRVTPRETTSSASFDSHWEGNTIRKRADDKEMAKAGDEAADTNGGPARDAFGFRIDSGAGSGLPGGSSSEAARRTSEREWTKHEDRVEAILRRCREPAGPAGLTRRERRLMKRLCRLGVPSRLRPTVWRAMSGADAADAAASSGRGPAEPGIPRSYPDAVAAIGSLDERIRRQIEGDLHRTFPDNALLSSEEGMLSLGRILGAFAATHPNIGYAQGINFVAGMLLIVYGPCEDSEAASYWTLAVLVSEIMPRDLFGEDLRGCHVVQRTLDRLVAQKMPRVSRHLAKHGCDLLIITSEWILCLFARSFPPETVARAWDSLMTEGFKVFYRVALSFFKVNEGFILGCGNLGELVAGAKERVRRCRDAEAIMHRAFHGIGSMPQRRIDRLSKVAGGQVDELLASLNKKRGGNP